MTDRKRVIKIVIITLITMLMGLSLLCGCRDKYEGRILSEMTEEECLQFIVDKGVVIPNDFKDYNDLGDMVKRYISVVEEEPDYKFMYNYPVALLFAEDIKRVVNEHYGIEYVKPDYPFSEEEYR